jgi:hypothetical protein
MPCRVLTLHALLTIAALAPASAIALAGPPPADDHPDNCADATPWPIGGGGSGGQAPSGELSGRLDVPGDVDWFELQLQPNHLYRFNPWTLDCGACPRARIFAPDCATEIARIEPFEPPKVYWFLTPSSGRLLAAVDSPTGVIGEYTVPVELIGGPFQDDHPSTVADAAPLAANAQPVSGTLEFGQDADVFVIEARPGAMYRLDVLAGLENSSDLTVMFGALGADGTLASTPQVPDPACATRPEGCSATRLIAGEGEPSLVYVWVQHRTREREDAPPLSYAFSVTDEGDFVATPGGPDCGTVPAVPVGAPIPVKLTNQSFSFQFWQFPVQAEHTYRVRLEATVGAIDLALGVTDTDCLETFAFNDPGNGRFDVYFRSPDDTPKRLFVERTLLRLDPLGRPLPGWCLLRVDDIGVVVDPEPDSAVVAAPMAIGGAISEGTLGYGGDVDWFRGPLTPGVNYRVELRLCTTGSDAGVIARVFPGAAPSTTLLATRDNGQPMAWIGRPIPGIGGGPLYIQLERGRKGETPLRYELRVTRPDCRADWDGSGSRDFADLFAYLDDYFANRGEFDDLGDTPGIGDLLAFLQSWFAGCP